MRLLWIATKSPWPPVDGGRLLLFETLAALTARGVRPTLVAPVAAASRDELTAALAPVCEPRLVIAAPRSRLLAAASAVVRGEPWTVARHSSRRLRAAVADEIERGSPHAVVAEQLQAFAQTAPAAAAGVPRLLRSQNVESALWRQLAAASVGARRVLFRREAGRVARAESGAVQAAAATVALSSLDALGLAELAVGSAAAAPPRIVVVPPPFPGVRPAAERTLPGEPALVLFGSPGWEPNARAVRRFLDSTWPAMHRELPRARLHLFGAPGDGDGIVSHAAPRDAREAFAPGALLLLPLDLASGIRMRILEAWARGVAVLATPAAASGLRVTPGEELLLGSSDDEWIHEVRRFAADRELGGRLVAAGRARLAEDHAPERFAERFLSVLAGVTPRAEGGDAGR